MLKARAGSQQQVAIYFRDATTLSPILRDFLIESALTYVAAYDQSGNLLAAEFQSEYTELDLPKLASVRTGVRETDWALYTPQSRNGLSERVLKLSVPIFSQVNPADRAPDRSVFGAQLAASPTSNVEYLYGYFLIGISEQVLVNRIVARAAPVAAGCLAFLVSSLLLGWAWTRRLSKPLSDLAKLADDLSEGELEDALRARVILKNRQIAYAVNKILWDMNVFGSDRADPAQLIEDQVGERTAHLHKRTLELSEAIDEASEAKNRMRRLAYYDSLTSLPNRRLFTEQLDLLLRVCKRHEQVLALLFIDLDNFKRINDSLGHNAGDVLLKEVGSRLSSGVRESDLLGKYAAEESQIAVSRLGGDEFTVVLNNIENEEDASIVATRLLECLQRPVMLEGHEIVITPSIGIAIATRDADNIDELLKYADTAMYHAKSSGKNSYSYFTEEMKSSTIAKLRLESDMRQAMERDEWVMYYQPQVNGVTGEIVGAEGLIRWTHPEHGIVSPARFIPLAEETGQIVGIGMWALYEVCKQWCEYRDQGLELPKVSVNVSSLQFNADFVDLVGTVLNETGIKPNCLQIELTESAIMEDVKTSVEALHDLKALGVSLSVDDFGTGYSSLSYLSRFPLDELKIDRSFVVDFDKSTRNASLISTIIAIGESLRFGLVAEGVDSPDQFNFLIDNGAEVMQGFLFSEPLPANEFSKLLRGTGIAEKALEFRRLALQH